MLELSRALFKSEVRVITTLGLRDDAYKRKQYISIIAVQSSSMPAALLKRQQCLICHGFAVDHKRPIN